MNLSPGQGGTWEELPAGPVFEEDGASPVREVCPMAPSMECSIRKLPQWEGQGLRGDIGGAAPLRERSDSFPGMQVSPNTAANLVRTGLFVCFVCFVHYCMPELAPYLT